MSVAAALVAGSTACSTEADPPHPSDSGRPDSAHDICLSGVHATPVDLIRVERATLAPLADVKAWILSTSPAIDWETFSSSLADAPLDEMVAVCVLSTTEGQFTPQGIDPVAAVVEIVRPDGQATGFLFGDTDGLLATTPSSFPAPAATP